MVFRLSKTDDGSEWDTESSHGYETTAEGLPSDELVEVDFRTSTSIRFTGSVLEKLEEDEVDQKSYRPFERAKLGKGLAARWFRRFPRAFACGCGIIIPLFLLVLLSLVCGKFLGEFEYQLEIKANDAAMRRRAKLHTFNDVVGGILQAKAQVCLHLYRNGSTIETLDQDFQQVLEREQSLAYYTEHYRPLLEGVVAVNLTQYSGFIDECGNVMKDFADNLQREWFGNLMVETEHETILNFNWNRCVNRSSAEGFNRIFYPSTEDVKAAHPAEQERVYSDVWNERQSELFPHYYAKYMAENDTSIIAVRLNAFNSSVFGATAGDMCAVNVASAGWFWFTVMTTIGYGNQAPVSRGGRVMVFTLGFASIVFFGCVLATAGTITSHLVYDLLSRLKSRILVKKQVMMLVWGLLWLGWMAFLSYCMMTWTRVRLTEEIPFEDAYWFSYISTTTVGLGDFYPAPATLFIGDLLALSLSFLSGFVLLSSFLSELSQLIGLHFPEVSEELGKRLKFVGATTVEGVLDGERVSMRPGDGTSLETDKKEDEALPGSHPGIA